MPEHPTGTVTLVFTDLEGSSELSERHGAAFEHIRSEHFDVLRQACGRWQGFEVETAGDALFVVFSSAADAVQFAADAQQAMAGHPWPMEVGSIRVRIGMHTGEPFIGFDHDRPTYRGPATNRAARVQAAGHGGQILASQATRDEASPLLPPPLSFQDAGAHRLKGVGEEHLWQVCHPALRREFPPLATLNPERHNLPTPPSPLIGRETEIEAWHQLLQRPSTRLLTLIGFGGMGKTRAALQLAELCVQDFAQGVWWVELDEARSSDDMISRLAQVLRLYLQPQPSVREQLWNHVRDRRLLLVLDNTEQIGDAASVIKGLLQAAPGISCVVTSRRALELREEHLHEVPPLDLDDAQRLFVERARARRPDFEVSPDNASDVAQLCRRLEGVPLALELAASRIITLAPREILTHLTQRFRVLQSRSPDLPPRQRALRGAIDWSHDLLADADKALFAELGAFYGGFTLDACEAVADPLLDAMEGLEELRRQSLLRARTDAQTQQTKFSMLDSVQEYACLKLAETAGAGQEVRQRHAAYFTDFARRQIELFHTPHEAGAMQQLELAVDNVRGAIDWASTSGCHLLAAELGLSVSIFLQRRGLWKEAMSYIQKSLTAVGQAGQAHSLLAADLMLEAAGIHLDQFQADEAGKDAERALLLLESLSHARGGANAHNVLGLAAKGRGDFEAMRHHFMVALSGFEQEGDEVGASKVHNNLGNVEVNKLASGEGDSEAASRHLNQALRLRRLHGDLRGSAETLVNLGALATELGQMEEAKQFYEEALAVLADLRSPQGVATALCNLAEVAEAQGRLNAAWRLGNAAHYLFQDIGSPFQTYSAEVCHRLVPARGEAASPSFADQPLHDIAAWALAE